MKNKLNRLTHKVLKSPLLQMEVFHQIKKKKKPKTFSAEAHVKERQTEREREQDTSEVSAVRQKPSRCDANVRERPKYLQPAHTESTGEQGG